MQRHSPVTPDEDDIDIDVCLCCGSYYSLTPTILELWRKSFNYREGAVVPQLCHRCMREE